MKINKLETAVILALFAVIAAKIDSVGYLYYLHDKGLDFSWFVGFDVWMGYYKTMPGLILTLLWVLPAIGALILFYIGLKSEDKE